MSSDFNFDKTIQFNATPEAVWDLLVNPAKVKLYMFGCDIETTWEVGTPLLWYITDKEGTKMLAVKGDIIAFEAGKLLEYNMLPPAMQLEDVPQNYMGAAFTVEAAADGKTNLHIKQYASANCAKGEARFKDVASGWEAIQPLMEKVLSA